MFIIFILNELHGVYQSSVCSTNCQYVFTTVALLIYQRYPFFKSLGLFTIFICYLQHILRPSKLVYSRKAIFRVFA